MAMDPLELRAALEAVVYVSTEPVTLKSLAQLFPDETEEALAAALTEIEAATAQPGRGLVLSRVAGGHRLTTRPEVHAHVIRFAQQERAQRLSLRTLETLSVIAYKQPVTAAEVGEIRGVDPGGTLKTLLDRGLIKIVGRKKVVGRPFVYGTTTAFLTAFGLNDLSELPSLKELSELTSDLPNPEPGEIELLTDGLGEGDALDAESDGARDAASAEDDEGTDDAEEEEGEEGSGPASDEGGASGEARGRRKAASPRPSGSARRP